MKTPICSNTIELVVPNNGAQLGFLVCIHVISALSTRGNRKDSGPGWVEPHRNTHHACLPLQHPLAPSAHRVHRVTSIHSQPSHQLQITSTPIAPSNSETNSLLMPICTGKLQGHFFQKKKMPYFIVVFLHFLKLCIKLCYDFLKFLSIKK